MSDWDWLDWFPIVFLPLKLLVVGVGWYYSVKWHYDQDQKKKNETRAAQLAAVEPPLDAPDAAVNLR